MLAEINDTIRKNETEHLYRLVLCTEGMFEGKFKLQHVYTDDYLIYVFESATAALTFLDQKGWILEE